MSGPGVVVLDEYQTAEVELGNDDAIALQRLAGKRLLVGLGSAPGRVQLRATEHVGTLVTPSVTVLVRPKVPLENLFLLLGVGVPADAWGADAFGYATSDDLLAAFATFFARAADHATATGLVRAYRPASEALVAMRGRVDVAAMFRRPALTTPVPCSFDEYTEDVIENRVLRRATALVQRIPGVAFPARRGLRHLLSRFEGVADAPVSADDVDRINFTRLNQHYEPALRLAQALLRYTTLIDRAGAVHASSFMLDMNRLYQDWLTAELRRVLQGRLGLDAEPKRYLGVGNRVAMAPDLVFSRRGEPVLVGDAKYKLTDTGLGRSSDYYQLLAYTTAMNLPAGILVYCSVDGEAPEKEVVVRHAGKRLLTYALPLAGSTQDVAAAVTALADRIAHEARGTFTT